MVTTTAGHTQVLLTLPADRTGTPVPVDAVTARHGGQPVRVDSVADVPSSQTDVVLVMDTSAASAPRAAKVRAQAAAVLRGLGPQTQAAVVATGGGPAVLHRLGGSPREAAAAAATAGSGGTNRLVDSLLAAVRMLPADPERQQDVVVVTAGADEGSTTPWSTASVLLARRGIALDVLDLSPSGNALPGAGAQCPGPVDVTAAASAGSALAAQIEDRRRVTLPELADPGRLALSVRLGDADVEAVVRSRPAAAPGPAVPPRSSSPDDLGAGTLLLAFVVGLLGLSVLLASLAARSSRGTAARRAAAELVGVHVAALRERRLPDARRRVPRRELARRRRDAVVDLLAVVGDGPTARELAEVEAHAEASGRAAAAQHLAALKERQAGQARAAERQRRARERAEWLAAEERAQREDARLHPAGSVTPLRDWAAAAPHASLAMLAEAERLLAAQREAAQQAVARRQRAEQLAEEAVARAERERAAAVAAQQAREAAERAAAEAERRAERERRTAGEASQARQAAERSARAAAERLVSEQQAADAALARRRAAEARAAEAEAAQDDAVERELAALQAAEEAKQAHQQVVARTDARPAPTGPAAAVPAPATPALDATTRRVTARVPERTRHPAVDGHPEVGNGSLTGGPPRAPEPPRQRGPADEPAADEPAADAPPADVPEATAPAAPAAPAASAEVARAARVAGAPPAETPSGAVWAARAASALLVPLVVLLHTTGSGAWWSGLSATQVGLLGCAAVLAGLGVWWVWRATEEPHALLRSTAREIAAAGERQQQRTATAAGLLAEVRAGRATDASWDAFAAETGLTVPGATRQLIDPGMDPAALVRYLNARQHGVTPVRQSLLVVTVVPALVCLVPAALIVWSL